MDRHQLLRVALWHDPAAVAVKALAQAVAEADLFDDAAAIYVTGHERRARAVRLQVRADFPEGTPERIARTIIARHAPQMTAIDAVERDFLFFELLGRVSSRAPSRAMVDALLQAWKILAVTIPPDRRGDAVAAMRPQGERAALLASVIEPFMQHLRQNQLHDPEDALWLAARVLHGRLEFTPRMAVIDDLESLNPARQAFIEQHSRTRRNPCITAIGTSGLMHPDMLVEIEATAVF